MSDLIVPGDMVGRVTRTLQRAAAITESPFTYQQQVQVWPGERWVYEIEFYPQRGAAARGLDAIMNRLGGPGGTFIFEDPTTGRATIPGSPAVNGANQLGNSLVTNGWPVSTPVMEAGEFFSVGTGSSTRLYQLTAGAVSDAGGNATLQVIPEIVLAPSDSALLEVTQPQVLLRLTSPAPAAMSPGVFYTFSLSAVQAL